MSHPVKLFLGSCYEPYPLDGQGQPHPQGKSNRDIGQWFREEILRLGDGRIDVAVVLDPLEDPISESVKHGIASSDAAIFVFPKRVQCQLTKVWTTSQYVISESGFAAARFRHRSHGRIFGFVEEHVGRQNLGLAFPSDLAVPQFNRERLHDVLPALERAVKLILEEVSPASDAPEPVLLDKKVHVHRNGHVRIEARHRFHIKNEMNRFRMGHTIWRVKSTLPAWQDLVDGEPDSGGTFLRCWLRSYGPHDVHNVVVNLNPGSLSEPRQEMPFHVELSHAKLQPGDVVDYQFAYAYDKAFFDPAELSAGERNSVGLRTGSRGMVHEASLTLLFERNWIGKELHPALDLDPGQKGPIIRTRSDTNLPGYVDLSAFWHSDEGWRSDETMHPSADVSSPLFDAYTWSRRNFSGIARVSWDPAMNYHTKRPRLQSAQRRPNAPSKGA